MFEVLGSLFGSKKSGEAIIEGVTNGIDKLWYTDEEKAEDVAKAKREGMAVYMKWLESTSGSRLARRILSLTVTGIWALEHLSSVTLGVVSVWVDSPENFIKTSEMLAAHANDNNALVGVVLLFYFGGPAAMEGTKGLVTKWVNRGKE